MIEVEWYVFVVRYHTFLLSIITTVGTLETEFSFIYKDDVNKNLAFFVVFSYSSNLENGAPL